MFMTALSHGEQRNLRLFKYLSIKIKAYIDVFLTDNDIAQRKIAYNDRVEFCESHSFHERCTDG